MATFPESNAGPYNPDPYTVMAQMAERKAYMESLQRVIATSPQSQSLALGAATVARGGDFRGASETMNTDMGKMLREISNTAIMHGMAGQNPGAILSGMRQAISSNPMMANRIGVSGSGAVTNALAETATIAMNKALFSGTTGGPIRGMTNGFGTTAIGGLVAGLGERGTDFSKFMEVKNGKDGTVTATMLKGADEKIKQLMKDATGMIAAMSNITGSRDSQELLRQIEQLTGSTASAGNIKRLTSAVGLFQAQLAGTGISAAEGFKYAQQHKQAVEQITGSSSFGGIVAQSMAQRNISTGQDMPGLKSFLTKGGFEPNLPNFKELQQMNADSVASFLNSPGEGNTVVDAIAALSRGQIKGADADEANKLLSELESGKNMNQEQRLATFAKLSALTPNDKRVSISAGSASAALGGLSTDAQSRVERVRQGFERGVNTSFVSGTMSSVYGDDAAMSKALPAAMMTYDSASLEQMATVMERDGSLDILNGKSVEEQNLRKIGQELVTSGKLGQSEFDEMAAAFSTQSGKSGSDKVRAGVAVIASERREFFTAGNRQSQMGAEKLAGAKALSNIRYSGKADTFGDVAGESTFTENILKGISGDAMSAGAIGGGDALRLAMMQDKSVEASSTYGSYENGGLTISEDEISRMARNVIGHKDMREALGLDESASMTDVAAAFKDPGRMTKFLHSRDVREAGVGINDKDNSFHMISNSGGAVDKLKQQLADKANNYSMSQIALGGEWFDPEKHKDLSMDQRVQKAREANPDGAQRLDAVLEDSGLNSATKLREIYEQSPLVMKYTAEASTDVNSVYSADSVAVKRLMARAKADPQEALALSQSFDTFAASQDVADPAKGPETEAALKKRKAIQANSRALAEEFKKLGGQDKTSSSGGAGGNFSGRLVIENTSDLALLFKKIS